MARPVPRSRPWRYPLTDYETESWFSVCPRAVPAAKANVWCERLVSGVDWEVLMTRFGEQPRKTKWFTRSGNTSYTYGGTKAPAHKFPLWMEELMATVMPLFGIHRKEDWPDSCNLNLYEDGRHGIGWHADNETIFNGGGGTTRILSASFGAARTFEVR